jgi:hypothetical protein
MRKPEQAISGNPGRALLIGAFPTFIKVLREIASFDRM